MLDWNSLRAFILTARHGSTLRAARALGVNQTTVMRRIADLERTLGLPLFHRHRQGYRLSADGEALLPQAEAMERQADALLDKARERRRQLSGTLRITATELTVAKLLAPAVAALRDRHPEIATEIVVTDARLDLQRGEADIAIRAGGANEEDGVIRRKIMESVWGVYGSRSLIGRHGEPLQPADLAAFPVIAGDGSMAATAPNAWLLAAAGNARVAYRSNSMSGLLAATKAGMGLCALPALAASGEPDLVLCAALPTFAAPVWLCYHESRKDDPLLRTVAGFLGDWIGERGDAEIRHGMPDA
ncbi:HTH-type transcriptional regulator HdfR [Pleomorphomonas sp. T1.2MG-36]|uniref:LysR family transcriptional regulator n=1 Tax=Pleomorphomonas sp. T1.2MG-36 TaxID=3041167 RepID=UPI0024775584|nr:LysR family transcriptional regulator [Pleomorphomonas sp. T1.2MG-36]CAI9417701.1 HTH-type transcriptional regulator HdfR [Pleomorphomonas sp. T1.2MG-36]